MPLMRKELPLFRASGENWRGEAADDQSSERGASSGGGSSGSAQEA